MEKRGRQERELWLYVQLIILATVTTVNGQQCVLTNNGQGLESYFRDYRYNGVEDNTIPRGHQAIIPSYRFGCSGCITEWGVDVHRGGAANSRRYTLDLQVWRPSPTVDDSTGTGCYSLVGNNRFTSVDLGTTQLAQVAPLPNDRIQVQPGDVLGFFVDNPNNEKNGVVALKDNPYSADIVWFGNVEGYVVSNSECPYPVRSHSDAILNTMRRAAPVISLSMTDSCPPVPPETSESSIFNPTDTILQPTTQTSSSSQFDTPQATVTYDNNLGTILTQSLASPSNRVPLIAALTSSSTPRASVTTDNVSTIFTQSPASPSNRAPLIAALTGGGAGALLLILVVVVTAASFAVCTKTRKCHKATLPSATTDDDNLSTNYNYGISMQHMGGCRHSENMYDAPNVLFPAVEKVDTKRNEAYNVTLARDDVSKPTQDHNSYEYDYIIANNTFKQ